MNGTRVSRWTDGLIAFCVAVASAAMVIWQNSHVAVLWDLSYILENSYRISLGQIPYRDFPFPYPPLTFLTQAALIKLTGRVFFHHVLYCAVVNGLSVLLTWRILLRILYATTNKRLLALVLTTPLAVLSVYGIFPHPFYDCDCTFVVLVCLFLLSRFQHGAADGTRENGDAAIPVSSVLESFFAGVLLVIPFFTKQNTGGAFLISAVGCLVLLFLIDIYNRRNISKYILLFAGLTMSLCVAILLIHHFAGLHNYYRWTFRFAAQRRMPAFADMIGMYKDTNTVWWLLPVVVGLVLLWLSRRNRQIGWLSVVLILVPCLAGYLSGPGYRRIRACGTPREFVAFGFDFVGGRDSSSHSSQVSCGFTRTCDRHCHSARGVFLATTLGFNLRTVANVRDSHCVCYFSAMLGR
jgi:hypothetical protein